MKTYLLVLLNCLCTQHHNHRNHQTVERSKRNQRIKVKAKMIEHKHKSRKHKKHKKPQPSFELNFEPLDESDYPSEYLIESTIKTPKRVSNLEETALFTENAGEEWNDNIFRDQPDNRIVGKEWSDRILSDQLDNGRRGNSIESMDADKEEWNDRILSDQPDFGSRDDSELFLPSDAGQIF